MKIFLFLLQSLPAILAAVVGIEHSIKAPGATKKQIVMDIITIAAIQGEKMPEAHVTAVSAAIDNVVSILNASGVFEAPARLATK